MGLVYNVYLEDCNSREIIVYNIFNHSRFYEDLIKIKKTNGETFESFSQAVKSLLLYYFWSRSEYEIVLTSWPPYIESKELDRITAEKEDFKKNNGFFYRSSVNLSVEEKISIYDQVLLNWDIFIKYLWDNRELIKKRREK